MLRIYQPSLGLSREPRKSYDVVVVGSGAGGGTLAYALGQRGLGVLLVERGDFVKPPAGDRQDAVGWARDELDPALWDSCVGGLTKYYGAALYRMRESDFHARELEAGASAAWPITYDDLEPYYTQAEIIYAVHGSPAGDPTDPPRSAPYPYPAIPHQEPVKSLIERIEASGVPVAAIPRGLDYRDQGTCRLCHTCDAYYCSLDAKMDSETACIRPALASGNVDLLTRTECLRVLSSADGKLATGVELRTPTSTMTVRAGVVAVCGGLAGTPRLLRRSRTDKHPEGLGNTSGSLGRYLCGHTAVILFSILGTKPVPKAHTKTFAINSLNRPSREWPYPLGVIQMAGQLPIRFAQMRPGLRQVAKLLVARSLTCFCMTEEPSSRDYGYAFAGDELGNPGGRPPICRKTLDELCRRAKRIFRDAGCSAVVRAPGLQVGWHGVGSARMGDDPDSSVVDAQCRVHGLENLYVVDASSLPSPGALNTGLTIMALALRAGEHIAAENAGRGRVERTVAAGGRWRRERAGELVLGADGAAARRE